MATKRAFPGYDKDAVKGQADLDPLWRFFNMVSGAVGLSKSPEKAKETAWGNTVRLNNEAADRIERLYGYEARQEYCRQVAQRYQKQMERIYCGNAERMKEVGATMHSFAADYSFIPIVSTLADWCGYVSEGNVEMTVLYGLLSVADVVDPGSGSVVKSLASMGVASGSKIFFGAGMKEAVDSQIKKVTAKEVAEKESKGASDQLLDAAGRLDVQERSKLIDNLEKAGVVKPDYSSAAHHIVAKAKQNEYAIGSREILNKYGIDVNNAANGVYLRTTKEMEEGAYHPSLHTNEYYKAVYDKLKTANSRDEVLVYLEEIRIGLIDGTFGKG